MITEGPYLTKVPKVFGERDPCRRVDIGSNSSYSSAPGKEMKWFIQGKSESSTCKTVWVPWGGGQYFFMPIQQAFIEGGSSQYYVGLPSHTDNKQKDLSQIQCVQNR